MFYCPLLISMPVFSMSRFFFFFFPPQISSIIGLSPPSLQKVASYTWGERGRRELGFRPKDDV